MSARPAYAPLRLLAAALALALATSCGARAGRPNAAPKEAESAPAQRTGPKITLTDAILEKGGSDTVRFGRLHSGEIAELRVWLVNDASRAVAVASYGRSCGCTTLEFDREPVAPALHAACACASTRAANTAGSSRPSTCIWPARRGPCGFSSKRKSNRGLRFQQ